MSAPFASASTMCLGPTVADDTFVSTALGARLVRTNVATGEHVVHWLDEDGGTRAVRPATVLEVSMWGLLMSKQSEWHASGDIV